MFPFAIADVVFTFIPIYTIEETSPFEQLDASSAGFTNIRDEHRDGRTYRRADIKADGRTEPLKEMR